MSPDQISKIKSLASDVARREGCVLYDLEFLDKGPRILRVYVDKLVEKKDEVDGEQVVGGDGVSIEDLVNVSRGLNLVLDVEDIISGGAYELEVSSPGLERKLNEPWHYEKAVGKDVQVKFTSPDGSNKTVKGKIISVSDSGFELQTGPQTEVVAFKNVLKAKVVFLAPDPGKSKKGPASKPTKIKKKK